MPTDQGQLFFEDNGQTIRMLDVPIDLCRHSRFNTRKTRSEKEIQKLADRIRANGFERTRALWAVEVDGWYEVFAGGTRLEAAKRAALSQVPIMLHEGHSDKEISRRETLDNENDEYHANVPIVDVWAEYARIKSDEGWNQEEIAAVKGLTSQGLVSERLRLHEFKSKYPAIEKFITDEKITEAKLRQIIRLSLSDNLATWLQSEQAWFELASYVVRGQSKDGDKSDNSLQKEIEKWKEFITEADESLNSFPEEMAYYDIEEIDDDGNPIEMVYLARQAFLRELKDCKARSLTSVKTCARNVRSEYKKRLDAYQAWLELKTVEAAKQAIRDKAEKELLEKFRSGDGVTSLQEWTRGSIRLLLTDPPYGKDYQTNRRWRSQAPDKITGDTHEEAMALLRSMLVAAVPHLSVDSHVIIFCAAAFEPEVRQIVVDAGLTWASHGIWLKDEHSAGDVECALGPDHECLVHAIKGRPKLSPRHAETFKVARTHETSHPNEKPLQLLHQLIECMTSEGDLVVDPFAGCASTLVAALKLNREFWGAEIEQKYHEEGTTRLLKIWEAQCSL